MKQYLQEHPDAKVALDQLVYAVPWFDTYNTVTVRKAMEDQVQAILSGKIGPANAVAAAQKSADALLRPCVEQTAVESGRIGVVRRPRAGSRGAGNRAPR
jgi:sn-glycerol 3-phosphate transport system substrate-binding protein